MSEDRLSMRGREVGIWHGSPVTRLRGSLREIYDHLPEFDRRPFRVTTGLTALTGDNPNFDVIVRLPHAELYDEIPVGVVSKNYTLVPHREVLRLAQEALRQNGISPEAVVAEVDLTDLGERMELILTLPREYHWDPGDGHPVALQVRCTNSVDASTRFMAVVGWIRFVCGNGLIVGTATSHLRKIHNADMDVREIGSAIRSGLRVATGDLRRFKEWTTIVIADSAFRQWIDQDLRKAWGVKAATRVWSIVCTGYDVQIANPFEKAQPSQRQVQKLGVVPGAEPNVRSAYSISQALAWLARDRRDLQERTVWMLAIPELMEELLSRN